MKSSIQTSHPPEIVPSVVSSGEHAFASSLQRSSSSSFSLLPESSSVMAPFRNYGGNIVHTVTFSISSLSDFAYLVGNDFSLSTSQLAMTMSSGVSGFTSSLQHGSFAESFSFLPKSSSVKTPFLNYVDNRMNTASSFTSSSYDHAFFDGKGYSVSMPISMPFSTIHQMISTSAEADQKLNLSVTSVIKEFDHTATYSVHCVKSSDVKEAIIEVASSFKSLDGNYHVSNAISSQLETVYWLRNNYSSISNANKDVEMSIGKEHSLQSALFKSQRLFIVGTFYSDIYSTVTFNFPTIRVSSYSRKPSNQSLSGML
ncbi:hypothetical protein CHS0354_032065 [Potamilus streckersoni]|uniref:Uncharacterized protein n=1 Tax=Potamilus streckersoni TaxID=2493646 RepID=A0AAE0WHD1_9BIVA|nr:hypothetical protein CHS0354_032065 [Potamilus streckersoni]